MVNVGVIGHTGRLGKPLVEILNRHPYTNIVYTESRKEGRKGSLLDVDLVFLALPYNESEKYLLKLGRKKVVDLSIDHRCDNDWIYGLPELNRDMIKTAERITNPGCYATSILEALLPVKDIVTNIRIKAYSGVSGKPNQPVIKDKGIERYAKDKEHPQVAEIEKYLGKQIEFFEPYLVYPLETGIVAKIDAQLQDSSQVYPLFENSFKDKPFVKLVDFQPEGINVCYLKKILIKLKNSNYCHISFNKDGKLITITSALDNLIKGGAGQAVQNFNLMYGFDETTGLL
ncbi:MAG: hypothetical protein KAU20_06250 [Nanoarchaeota archaeon]|nr:hypothetical protein [Nanoarchaeota archaeon]